MKLVLKSGKSKRVDGTGKHIGMVSNCYRMDTRMIKEMRRTLCKQDCMILESLGIFDSPKVCLVSPKGLIVVSFFIWCI